MPADSRRTHRCGHDADLLQPVLDFFPGFLGPRSSDDQVLCVPLHSTPRHESVQDGALPTEPPHRPKTASFAISRVRIEWDDGLASQAVLAQKALDRWRQSHASRRKAQKHHGVSFDVVDIRPFDDAGEPFTTSMSQPAVVGRYFESPSRRSRSSDRLRLTLSSGPPLI